ncbi:MAG: tRNA (guanosine(37)-N1)-methyltransferase TrmD [Holosporales bacterium]|jgi:tRNA (guanine37-N1)-methyltransferase|nr:tRNA (guanosine(37)-N1)-methyltransferase TrmD [Holosporales bacterium]
MLVTVVTIFPEMFPGPLAYSLLGRALGKYWALKTINLRDFATDKHKKVDDTPYGGGAGMVMKADVVDEALRNALSFYAKLPKLIFMTPRGIIFSQKLAHNLIAENETGMIILCGRYEGVDQRAIDYWKINYNMLEISIGDYILFGGEIPAMVIIDTCLRLVPGMMNNSESLQQESFSIDLLEYPQYTKPAVWRGENVPPVLLSGNHKEIAMWRTEKSEQITKAVRPDLWAKYKTTKP